MPSFVKVSGNHKQIKKMYVRVSGSWKAIKKAYSKVNGTWEIVYNAGAYPTSLIAMFNSDKTAESGWTELNYGTRLIMLVDNLPGSEQTGGSASHTHSNDGSDDSSATGGDTETGGDCSDCRTYPSNQSHTHDIPSHTHNSSSNFPQYHSLKFFTGVDEVKADMIIGIESGSSYDSNDWEDAGLNKFIGCDSSPGTDGGYSSHTHGTKTWNSNTISSGYGNRGEYNTSRTHVKNHYHSITESLSSVALTPKYYTIKFIKAKNTGVSVPIGGLLLAPASLSTIPSGFSLVVATNGRIIKASSSTGNTGGSDLTSHTHSQGSISVAYHYTSHYDDCLASGSWSGQPNDFLAPGDHSHTWTHSHTSVDATPSYIKLAMLKKN